MKSLTPIVLTWLTITGGGIAGLAKYSVTPGEVGVSPAQWPSQSEVSLNREGFTLIMLVHPRCPCTRSSIKELAKIMAASHGKLQATVLFFKPTSSEENWPRTPSWQAASEIANVQPLVDIDGRIAQQFGAQTSGQTLLYDQNGHLRFAGGITIARGHEGDNIGEDAVIRLISKNSVDEREIDRTPTFGCHLYNRHAEREVTLEAGK